MVASLATIGLLLVLRATRHWPPLWRRLFPVLLLAGGTALLVLVVTQVEPLRVRAMSLLVGREDSSNNFRINVWLAALDMIRDRPWIGIGPGNNAFNLIYPLYQQPSSTPSAPIRSPWSWRWRRASRACWRASG